VWRDIHDAWHVVNSMLHHSGPSEALCKINMAI
jgi:hypothetical protein